MSLPKIIGLFRLTRDSELRYSSDGKAILKMGLASSEKFGDRETQCFIDAIVFGKMAETINTYAGEKGTQIFLTGKLQTETWVDQTSGQNRSKHSVIVETMQMLDSKDSGNKEPYQMPTPEFEKKPMPNNNLPEIDINEDSIPF